MALYVQETYVNASEGYILGKSPVVEAGTDDLGQLYRALVWEFGRCIGKAYIDGPDGKAIPVGWVFVKRMRYQDVPQTYLQETWVTVHKRPPSLRYHYLPLTGGDLYDPQQTA